MEIKLTKSWQLKGAGRLRYIHHHFGTLFLTVICVYPYVPICVCGSTSIHLADGEFPCLPLDSQSMESESRWINYKVDSSMEIQPSKYYPASEAAELLGVTTETVKGYCRANKMKSRKVGPKKVWYVMGHAILEMRKAWNISDLPLAKENSPAKDTLSP